MPSNADSIDALQRDYELSRSVRGFLSRCESLAQEHRFKGAYGTGLMLISIFETRLDATTGFYAPRELVNLIAARDAQDRFGDACKAFLREEALKADVQWTPRRAVSRRLRDVFRRASVLPAKNGKLASRHLIACLLDSAGVPNDPDDPDGESSSEESNAHRLLREAQVDRQALLHAFLDKLVANALPDEQAYWQERASEVAKRLPPERIGKTDPGRPAYWPDIPTGKAQDDCLKLESIVSAMARLIASPDLEGNLSLGIFGNWGSGKSFFMRRLREEIDLLAEQAGQGNDTNSVPNYWTNIAQVEFNAWHYADANLWASLVSHLFEQLVSSRGPKNGSTAQLERALGLLSLSVQARGDAERAREARAADKGTAEKRLESARSNVEGAANKLAAAVRRSAWTSVDDKLKQEGPEIAAALARARGEAEQGVKAARAAVTSMEPLYAEIQALTTTSGRVQSLMLQLFRDRKGRTVLYQTAGIVALALLALAALALFMPTLINAGTSLSVLAAGVTGGVTRASAWVRTRAASALTMLEPLTKFRASIESALTDAQKEKDAAVSALQAELTAKSAALAAAEQDVAIRCTQVDDAVDGVKDVVSGTQVRRFIAERAASTDYQQKLGLTALIRRDFEQLSGLVEGHNAWRRDPTAVDAIRERLLRALPPEHHGGIDAMFQQLGINRIVIYIDDLDRCPPGRVVDVLQTIHLLLAFPVFVVVVGVDARWMHHSLRSEYPTLLGGQKAETSTGYAPELVSPTDYLEKIFQIPFWIPPLDKETTQALLQRVAGPATAPKQDGEPPPVPVPQNLGDRASPGPQVPPKASREATPPIGDGNSAARPANPSAPVKPIAKPTRRRVLELSPDELTIMNDLAVMIGRSPRAAKRFVNSYCLLKASLGPDEYARLRVPADLTAFRSQMLLLAVITGAPRLAAQFVTASASGTTALTQLEGLAAVPPHSVEARDTAVRVFDFCKAHKGSTWGNLAVTDINLWATRVAQFAFEDLAT